MLFEQRFELVDAFLKSFLLAEKRRDRVVDGFERRGRLATLELTDMGAKIELGAFVAPHPLFCLEQRQPRSHARALFVDDVSMRLDLFLDARQAGAVVGLHPFEHVCRRGVFPRIECTEPAVVLPSFGHEARELTQRTIRVGHRRSSRDSRSASRSEALSSFTFPSVRA